MIVKTRVSLTLATVLAAGAGTGLALAASPRNQAAEEANRTLVLDLYEGFFNLHDVTDAATAVADNCSRR